MKITYTEEEVKAIIEKTVDTTYQNFHSVSRTKLTDDLYEELRKKPQVFYRVCHETSLRGLWYDFNGKFTGIIHNEFDFCKHKELQMEYDPELVGWLSATDTLDKLFEWFPPKDILRLQDEGWYLHEFLAVDTRFYERFQHLVINQETSVVKRKMKLVEVSKIKPNDIEKFVKNNPEIATLVDGDLEVIII